MKGRLMGLPIYVWLGVAAGGLLLGIYLRRRGSSSGTAAAATSYPISLPATVSSPFGSIDNGVAGGGIQGAAPNAPNVSATDGDTVNALLSGLASWTGVEQTLTEQTQGLTDAIGSLVFSMPSSAGSGSSVVGTATAPGDGRVSPSGYTPTPTTEAHPASRASGKPKARVPAAAKPIIKTPIHYYTYKKDVPLKKGQTLHFAAGRGYYGG